MKRAGELNPGGMAAILGVDIPTLDQVCAEASTADEIVQVANDNCPGQVVISGHISLHWSAPWLLAKAAGAKRALPLPGQHCCAFAVDGFHPGGLERSR
jgi:[acyl-carrier-protein] S-malonyltransferase